MMVIRSLDNSDTWKENRCDGIIKLDRHTADADGAYALWWLRGRVFEDAPVIPVIPVGVDFWFAGADALLDTHSMSFVVLWVADG